MPLLPEPSRWALPDPALGPADSDVIAVGADLAVPTVFDAYCRGLFPMHLATGELAWWSPDPRGILPLGHLRLTRSLAKSMRRFDYSVDTAFERVMRECADERRESGWITEEFVETYTALHRLGWAHSVEVWQDGDLVGGLYGVEIGGLFAGESMFHRQRDASKAALAHLVTLLDDGDDRRLLDVQWATDHLASLGAVEVPRAEYLRRLPVALTLPARLAAAANPRR